MRTTLNISDALVKELRARSVETGLPFRRVVEDTLTAGLHRQTTRASQPAYRVRPHPLRLKAGFRNLSLNQVYDQVEAEEATK